MKCSELLRINQWTDSQARLSAWYLPPVSWAKKDFQKSVSDVNCSFVSNPLDLCFLQFDAMEQDLGILLCRLSIFSPGYSEPGVGEKESGALEFEYCGSSLFMELTCWPRSFPVGKVCPNSSGYRTFPRYLPVSYSACHTMTWPDIVHPTQGSQYRSRPWKALPVDFYFSLESRGDLWFYLYLIIIVRCFLQIKRPSAGQPCFLRMRKCNKARSSPALQQSGRCSTASVACGSSAHRTPSLFANCSQEPYPCSKVLCLAQSIQGQQDKQVFEFPLFCCVLCCPQCSPALSFSLPTA